MPVKHCTTYSNSIILSNYKVQILPQLGLTGSLSDYFTTTLLINCSSSMFLLHHFFSIFFFCKSQFFKKIPAATGQYASIPSICKKTLRVWYSVLPTGEMGIQILLLLILLINNKFVLNPGMDPAGCKVVTPKPYPGGL